MPATVVPVGAIQERLTAFAWVAVTAIHDEHGYRRMRRALARHFDPGWTEPNVEVFDVDLEGDRRLILHHAVVNGRLLEPAGAQAVLRHLAELWGYDVLLAEVDASGAVLNEYTAQPGRRPVAVL